MNVPSIFFRFVAVSRFCFVLFVTSSVLTAEKRLTLNYIRCLPRLLKLVNFDTMHTAILYCEFIRARLLSMRHTHTHTFCQIEMIFNNFVFTPVFCSGLIFHVFQTSFSYPMNRMEQSMPFLFALKKNTTTQWLSLILSILFHYADSLAAAAYPNVRP